jgi:hypothetical protein
MYLQQLVVASQFTVWGACFWCSVGELPRWASYRLPELLSVRVVGHRIVLSDCRDALLLLIFVAKTLLYLLDNSVKL